MLNCSFLTGKDGANVHGPNAVISMLHHALTNYGYGEKECDLHADNCGGNLLQIYYRNTAWLYRSTACLTKMFKLE